MLGAQCPFAHGEHERQLAAEALHALDRQPEAASRSTADTAPASESARAMPATNAQDQQQPAKVSHQSPHICSAGHASNQRR